MRRSAVRARWALAVVALAGCAHVERPFEAPVGKANEAPRVSRPFGVDGHRGEDVSADAPLGAPVRSVADGVVMFAGNGDRDGFTGWGNVVIVRHRISRGPALPDEEVESLSGHLETVAVRPDQRVRAGQELGTIGTGGGRYAPHLHFEIRERLGMGIQAGSGSLDGWVDPSEWLRAHGASPLR